MGKNKVSVIIHSILNTFETAYIEKLTKCLALQGFGEILPLTQIWPVQYDHFMIQKKLFETQHFLHYLFVTIQTFFAVFRQSRYILGGRINVSLNLRKTV